ncbi:Guanine nucleotide-binding protein alpha-3 subunit, partial [Reticulomyxa filosa]
GSTFELFDVGGQRSERSKWIHCFDSVDAVLFVAGLNCYDQNLFEDEQINAMDESIRLFNEVINSRNERKKKNHKVYTYQCKNKKKKIIIIIYVYFKKTTMILFLNKADLFATKIQTKELTVWDTQYTGTPNSADEGIEYIREKFKAQNEGDKGRVIYAHVTTATDRENVQKVFDDVQHSIVMGALAGNGLI